MRFVYVQKALLREIYYLSAYNLYLKNNKSFIRVDILQLFHISSHAPSCKRF